MNKKNNFKMNKKTILTRELTFLCILSSIVDLGDRRE